MRLVTYQSKNGPRAAAVASVASGRDDYAAETYVDLAEADSGLPASLKEIVALGGDGLRRAAAALAAGKPFDAAGVEILAPIPDPQKVIGVGLNYADHAAETGAEVGDEPVIFVKFHEIMQDANTNQLFFSVEFLVSYLSRILTLLPGDIIFTGTPPGVGVARKPQVFMKPGDTAEVEIENIGILSNPVVAES